MTKKHNFGIVYAAFGERYVFETLISINSLRNFHSEIPITVFTDQFDDRFPASINIIIATNTNDYGVKIKAMLETPYRKTLFLDTDTYLTSSLDKEIFNVLDFVDVCASIEVGRENWTDILISSKAFTEVNTGVMLIASNKNTQDFLQKWLQVYKSRKSIDFHDQTSCVLSLLSSNCRFFPLPNNLNFRFGFPQTVDKNVIILHGRGKNLNKIANRVNKFSVLRNWSSFSTQCKRFDKPTLHQRLKQRIGKYVPIKLLWLIRKRNKHYFQTLAKRFDE